MHVLKRASLDALRPETDEKLWASAEERFSTEDLICRLELAGQMTSVLARSEHLPDLRSVLSPAGGVFNLAGIQRIERESAKAGGVQARRASRFEHVSKEASRLRASARSPRYVLEGHYLEIFDGSTNGPSTSVTAVMTPQRVTTTGTARVSAAGALTVFGGTLSQAHVGTVITIGSLKTEIVSVTGPGAGTVRHKAVVSDAPASWYVPSFTKLSDALRWPVVHLAAMLCHLTAGDDARAAAAIEDFYRSITAYRRDGFDLADVGRA